MDYRITLDRPDLLLSLRRFKLPRLKAHRTEHAILGFDGQYLTIEAADQAVLVHAEGEWPGNAHVSTSLVRALVQAPPPGDPIIVRCDGEHLWFGPIKVGCRWRPISRALLNLTPTPDWVYGLALSYTQTRGHIIASGLTKDVHAAERKLAALVAKVAKLLAPAGVTVADVQGIVERRLEERYLSHG